MSFSISAPDRSGSGAARLLALLLLGGLVATAPTQARAGGFFIQEQSARDMGAAFAGASAVAEDAATIFYNPAGITQLGGPTAQVGGYLLMGRADLDDIGTTATTPGSGNVPVPVAGEDGDPFDPTPVANVYAAFPILAKRLDNRLWAGFGITAPFGLEANYDDGWFGRYDSTDSRLTTFDLSPTLAFAVTEWLSLGGSVNVQYADAFLQNALPNPLAPGGPSIATDGKLEVDGDDWSVGFTVGALLEPIEGTRLGASYRYGISHELDGEAEFEGLPAPLPDGSFDGTADLDLPDIVMLGLAHELTDRLTLLGQFNWFNWSSFDEIRVQSGVLPDLVSPQEYDDSYSIMAGLSFLVTDALKLRTGFQFDDTPTVGEFRSTRTPDADRYWAAVGASYAFGDAFSPLGALLSLDLSYVHIFVEDTEIERTDVVFAGTPAASSVTTHADVESSVDIVAFQIRARF